MVTPLRAAVCPVGDYQSQRGQWADLKKISSHWEKHGVWEASHGQGCDQEKARVLSALTLLHETAPVRRRLYILAA